MKPNLYRRMVFAALISLFLLALISYVSDYFIHKNSIGGMCFSSACLDRFYSHFSGSVKIVTEGVTIIAFLAAISGSIIALDNYWTSVNSSALSGHINHLKLFQSYVETECLKFGINCVESVDTFLWYRSMFPESRRGNVNVSKGYVDRVKVIRSEIAKSANALSKPSFDKKYTFTNHDHQRRIIASFAEIGVSISRNEPKQFFATETAAIRLVDSVNLTFSGGDDSLASIPICNVERSYL